MDTNQLTIKQQKFCNEYLVSFNAYQAALLAGYSENTARKAEILHIPMVQTYLREVMNKATARAEITHELLLNEYRKIAFANMGDYFDFRGNNKRMCELTDDEKAALSYYHIADITEDDGFVRGQVCKIKLHNKMAALDRIARHLNFFNVPAKVSATVPEVAVPDTAADDAFEAAFREENQEKGVECGKLKVESQVEECCALSTRSLCNDGLPVGVDTSVTLAPAGEENQEKGVECGKLKVESQVEEHGALPTRSLCNYGLPVGVDTSVTLAPAGEENQEKGVECGKLKVESRVEECCALSTRSLCNDGLPVGVDTSGTLAPAGEDTDAVEKCLTLSPLGQWGAEPLASWRRRVANA